MWIDEVISLKPAGPTPGGDPDTAWVRRVFAKAASGVVAGRSKPSEAIIALDRELLKAGYDVVLVKIADVRDWEHRKTAQRFIQMCWNGYEEVD